MRDALVIASHRDTFLKDDRFDPDRMFHYLDGQILASRNLGFASTRLLGEMAWALGATPGVDDLGLAPTLQWFAQNFQSRTRVNVVLEIEGLEGRRLAPEIEITAYRIVQEALTTVARHGRPSPAQVTRAGRRGCAPHSRRGSRHRVRSGCRERGGFGEHAGAAIALGGSLRVTTSPGEGVVIEATLPLAGPPAS